MRNQFDLSHDHKTTCDMGQLIPICAEEVLPGDTMRSSVQCFTRVAPMVFATMHRVEVRIHSFFVPNRILWDQWEDFITNADDTITKPTVTADVPGRVYDYMGAAPTDIPLDALPVRAYNKIWNEFFRDQELQVERAEDDQTVARCAWQKDFFTIARPEPQQHDAEPIPGDIVGGINNQRVHQVPSPVTGDWADSGGNIFTPTQLWDVMSANTEGLQFSADSVNISIDDFRRSMALQRFAEARMRYGERYVDYLRYIGVNPSDGRLDRPEYLGGGKQVLSFSEVLSQTETAEAGVGEIFGHGIGVTYTGQFQKMFEEHGWCISVLSARPKTVYQDAIPRKFVRREPMDYWQKELEVLPWQELYNGEVYAQSATPTDIFGWVPRYEEYRHAVSHVSNTMRGGTEEDWHLARKFDSQPVLNSSFVECTPSERIYQDQNMPNLQFDIKFQTAMRRFVGASATMGTDI